MLRLALLLSALSLYLLAPYAAHADSCSVRPIFSEASLYAARLAPDKSCAGKTPAAPAPPGKVVGSGIIFLYANDEAKNSSLNNVLHAIKQLEGKTIFPGEIFSFNREANLLQESIPYDLGPDVRNNLVKAGGVCMVSTLLATAAHDAGLPFLNERGRAIVKPVPHSRYYKYYHQVNRVGDRLVPIVEAAIAIKKDELGKPWRTVQDMQFINTSGRVLVLHFEPSFTEDDLDLSKPFGLIQTNQYLKVELRAISTGLDAWFAKIHALSN